MRFVAVTPRTFEEKIRNHFKQYSPMLGGRSDIKAAQSSWAEIEEIAGQLPEMALVLENHLNHIKGLGQANGFEGVLDEEDSYTSALEQFLLGLAACEVTFTKRSNGKRRVMNCLKLDSEDPGKKLTDYEVDNNLYLVIDLDSDSKKSIPSDAIISIVPFHR